jgi:hypothetical protein
MMPELDAYRAAHPHPEDDEAFEAFLATPPTTMAGMRAAVEYAIEVDRDCAPHTGGRIAPALLRSPLFAGMSTEGGDDD